MMEYVACHLDQELTLDQKKIIPVNSSDGVFEVTVSVKRIDGAPL